MTFTEMLDELAYYYDQNKAIGCIDWWQNQPIDLFQKNNDMLEVMIPNLGFDEPSSLFYKQHLEKQKQLVDYYLKNRNKTPSEMSISDAFLITQAKDESLEVVEKAIKRKQKSCEICGSTKKIRGKTNYDTLVISYFCVGEHEKNKYEGDETTEQRFKEYLNQKRFEEEVKPLSSAEKHKLEHDILFTEGDKTEQVKSWKKTVVDEKEANKMWDEL